MSRPLLLLLLPLVASACHGQAGDHEGEAQPEVWKDMVVPPAPALTAEEARATFRIAPGFRLELCAAEPLIEDPIAITWDEAGRLWVVELRSFMPDVDGTGEMAPICQVSVLTDHDADGRMDQATVFLDGLVNPRGVAIVDGGVLIAEPPNLWFCTDTDGDMRCDQKRSVARYGDPNPDNLEHTDNGLHLALDNWMYNAKSTMRLRWDGSAMQNERTAFRGQWGIDSDDLGRLYYNSNSSYLHVDLLPAHYTDRNPSCGPPVGQPASRSVNLVRDQSVHTIRVNPGINRGYQKHMLRPDGRLARTTAVSGLAIYRGQQFPAAYRGHAFVPEATGNAVCHFALADDGVRIRAEKQLYSDPDWEQREFLCSTDERFRPVDCEVGPDGALYVVDLYRGVLQHRRYVTSFLKKQVLERGLDKPLGLGRIWRIVHDDSPIDRAAPALGGVPSARLVELLAHPGGWWRQTAQRLLVARRDEAAVAPLRALAARGSADPLARIHALWTLQGLGRLDLPTVASALDAKDPRVQVMALRAGESLVGAAGEPGFIAAVCSPGLAGADEIVRVQLGFTLGSLPDASHVEFVGRMMQLLEGGCDSGFLRCAVLSSSAGRERELLEELVTVTPGGEAPATWGRLIGELSSAYLRRDRSVLPELLLRIATVDADWQPPMLDGVLRVTQGKGWKPLVLAEPPECAGCSSPSGEVTAKWEKAMSAMSWAEPVTPAPPEVLSTAQERLLEKGRALFQVSCATCHGLDGRGLVSLGAPLLNSRNLLGPQERAARIVLRGLRGPVEVDGQVYDLMMPGLAGLPLHDDEGLAGVLSWLRRQWGHDAPMVTPETVARIRAETAARSDPWTVGELDALDLATEQARWQPLWDGETLDGWIQYGGTARYHVEDGAIVGTSVPNSPNSFLCTQEHYGDFELEYEFKVDHELNSGVQVRSHLLGGRVRGYQIEIDADQSRKRFWTAGIYEEGLRGWLADVGENQAARDAIRQGDWNHVRVVAKGAHLATWLNGVPAAQLDDSEPTLTGFIGLQVHGVGKREDPLVVRWRNLRIKDEGRHVKLVPGPGMRHVPAEASTMGRPAPDGAVVLVGEGAGMDAWRGEAADTPPGWLLEDAVLTIVPGAGSIMTRKSFGDMEMHLEFQIPPPERGVTDEHHGNSGVYIQRRYEVQILDSFGGSPGADGCGALYGLRAPDVAAALAPGQWQTLDIEFTAPRHDDAGIKTAPARITARHNGTPVHEQFDVTRKTGAGQPEGPAPAPILIQDHGSPIRFRNVWVRRLD